MKDCNKESDDSGKYSVLDAGDFRGGTLPRSDTVAILLLVHVPGVIARLARNSFGRSQRANSSPGSVVGLPTSLNWKPASLVETSLATSEPPPVRSRVKVFPSTEYKPLKDCVGCSLGVKLHVKVFSLSNVSKKAEPSSRVAFQLPWKTVGLMLMGGVLGDGCSGGVSTVGGSGVGCAVDGAANSDGVVFSGGAIICSRSIAT